MQGNKLFYVTLLMVAFVSKLFHLWLHVVNAYTVLVISEYLLLCVGVKLCNTFWPNTCLKHLNIAHYASQDEMLGALFNGPIVGVTVLNI